MSKNKYKVEVANANGVMGERKKKDHTKTGKLARRREDRRLEAMARQSRRIQAVEAALKGGKTTDEITKYIGSFKVPAMALDHANFTLIKIRGGVPHSTLKVRETTPGVTPTATEATPPTTPAATEQKNKYRKKKAAKLAEAAAPQQ